LGDALVDLLALFQLGLLVDLALPVDVLLVEALDLLLRHVLAALLPQVRTEGALASLLVLLLPASRSE
jgi:hypothetical protein